MKLIIAGSRDFADGFNPEEHRSLIFNYLDNLVHLLFGHIAGVQEVISGGARGPDTWGEEWAKGKKVPVKLFEPDYDKYGPKVAPHMRNTKMAEYGDALICFWDQKSKGTKSMIAKAVTHNLCPIVVINPTIPF